MDLTQQELRKIISIGIELATEKNRNKLLDKILKKSMDVTNCDAGTLYVLEDNALKFKVMKTLSMNISQGENGEEIDLPPVPLKEENVCAYSAIHRKVINIEDVWCNDTFDFSGPKKYDAMTGYHTESLLVIPLANHEGEVIGVMQLINALDENGQIIVFNKEYEFVILSLASQAAIAISNMRYTEELKEQMWSFTEALATAIDERTPYNALHTRNVADYSGLLIDELNREYEAGEYPEYFDTQRKEQLIMGAFLHDIGKLIVPLEVMNKATRLGERLNIVKDRFELFQCYLKIRFLENQISKEEYEKEKTYLEDTLSYIEEIDIKGYLPDEDYEKVAQIAEAFCVTPDDKKIPLLTEEEVECLKIRKGTLTDKERSVMEDHVNMTMKILEKVHFNRYFKDCPVWAGQHHETLNGTGYPKHLTAENLSVESRILTVADIYDALISDRPYKKPMSKEKALDILQSMVDDGRLDGKIVRALKKCVLK